jgi:enoyl-CoA hydratase/carnithine racemase
MSKPLTIPSSYHDVPWRHIRIRYHPASSSIPTKVIIVELYRPEKYNAFTDIMMQDIVHAFSLFDVDDRVKAIIVTGHGNYFCAGADLDEGLKPTGEPSSMHRDR